MYMEKEQKKNETKEKKPLTEQQRQQRKKMLVYPLMGLLFLGCLWLIFAPSSEGCIGRLPPDTDGTVRK